MGSIYAGSIATRLQYVLVHFPFHTPGFEDLIKVHFTIQRDIVLKQCAEWLDRAVNPEHEHRLRKAIDELRPELEKL